MHTLTLATPHGGLEQQPKRASSIAKRGAWRVTPRPSRGTGLAGGCGPAGRGAARIAVGASWAERAAAIPRDPESVKMRRIRG